jgi:gliding motility-associated-like protein
MKTIFLSLIIFFCSGFVLSAQVLELSTDPYSATTIKPSDHLTVKSFYLNPLSNNELVNPDGMRAYHNQNYYFRFVMPETNDVTALIQFPDNMTAGMAAYVEQGLQLSVVDMAHLKNSPGSFDINQIEASAGQAVIVRLWFSEPSAGNTVQIGLEKRDPLLLPKAINVETGTYTAQELVEDILVTGCLQAFNVTYNGDPISIGYFLGNIGTSGFDEGIVLSSGDALDAEGPDASTSTGSSTSGGSDPDLVALNPGFTINDAAVLEFDFIPATDELVFEYIFGSEEFHEFANSSFNDVFGFFLSGPGISGPYSNNAINIALLPNGDPVTIDDTYNNAAYYVGSTDWSTASGQAYNDDIEYDGATIPLTATADVTACETYHIKLAIGDAGDSSYDSGVFLRAGSFTSGATFTAMAFNSWYSTDDVYEGCETYITFTRLDASAMGVAIDIPLDISGTAEIGVDYNDLPDTFTIPAGEMEDTLFIDVYEDAIPGENETITFTFDDGCPCDIGSMTITIDVIDEIEWMPTLSNSGPICQGETATITLELPAGIDLALADWEWQFDNSTGYTLDVTPDETTTYTLEWTHPCQTIEVTSTVTVVPPPDIDLGPDFTVAGFDTPLDAGMAGGNTGNWEVISGPGTGVFEDETASVSYFTVYELGTYELVWNEISLPPDCSNSDTLQIEFYHIPTADFTISESLCYGDELTVTFVGDAYDWAIFDWDFDGATIISGTDQGPFVITYPMPGQHEISLTVDEMGYAVSETNTVLVPQLLEHVLTVTDDPCYNSCNGEAEIVVTGGTLPYSYSWTGGTPYAGDLCVGDYGITVTDGNGCITDEQFSIGQPTELVYDTTFNHVDCFGNATGNTQMIMNGGTPPYTYVWSNGASTAELNGIIAGVYNVTVSDANDCWVTETFNITQPNALNISFTEDMAICEGQILNLMATPSGGTMPYTIYWSDGGDYVAGPEVQSMSPSETTTYSVYVEDAHNCISPIQDMTLTVSPEMSLDLLTENNSCNASCDGSAELTVHGGIPPFNFSWASDNRIMENLCSGLYDVTVVDQIGCNTDTVFFIDEPSPLYYNTYTETASCPGINDGLAYVEVGGGTPPYAYVWGNGTTNDSIQVTGGTYSLTITDAKGCREETQVVVDAPQDIQIIPDNVGSICVGGTAALGADVMGGSDPYNYTWLGDDGTSGFDHVFYASPESETDYYLTVTDDNGCEAYHEFTVNVKPPLEILSVTINQDTVCENAPVRLFVDVEGGNGGPYTMQLQDGQVIPSPFTIYPQESQMWYITLTDDCETPAVTDSIYIPVWPIPENHFVSDIVEGCPPLRVTFNELNTNDGNTYQWAFGDNRFGYGHNTSHVYNESGFYDITLLIRNQYGCENTQTINNMIEAFPKPYVDFYATPNEATILDPQIQFTGISEFADSIFWYFGDGDSSIWQVTKPVHFYRAKGEYGITMVGENSFGCTDTAFKFIRIVDEPTFWAANAFTPNGDGDNDCFRLCGNSIDANEFYLAVYNRWGEMVFETDLYNLDADCDQCGEGSWDGTYYGTRVKGDTYLQPGIYTWFTKYKDNFGNWHEYNGYVRLAR